MEEPDNPEAREAEPEAASPEPAPSPSNDERRRRLHTASGAFLGVFLVLHLLTNASALGGVEAYESIVGAMIRSKVWPLFEVIVLVPLAFHAVHGVRLLRRKSAPEGMVERYGDRRLWVAQRITAAVVLVFVVVHVLSLRGQRLLFGLSTEAVHTTLVAHLSSSWLGVPWMALLYLIGVGAATFHFSNGLFAATAAWRPGMPAAARRRLRIGAVAVGLALFGVGTATVVGLATGPRLFEWPARAPSGAPCGPAGSNTSN